MQPIHVSFFNYKRGNDTRETPPMVYENDPKVSLNLSVRVRNVQN
jgi:hypothetical protein